MRMFSSKGNSLPSNMWALNRFPCPAAARRSASTMSGSTKPPRFLARSDRCAGPFTSYSRAIRCTYSAMAMAPLAMFFTPRPLKNSAPPVEICTMPSELACFRPSSTAFTVSVEVTLKAG